MPHPDSHCLLQTFQNPIKRYWEWATNTPFARIRKWQIFSCSSCIWEHRICRRHPIEFPYLLLGIPVDDRTYLVFHASKSHLNGLLKFNSIFDIEAVTGNSLSRSGLSDIFVNIIRHRSIQHRFWMMKSSSIRSTKGIFTPNPSYIRGIFFFSIYVNILCPSMAPAIRIIMQTHSVDKTYQSSRSISIQPQ